MGIKVSSFDEVSRLISGNPLRNFPSQSKGRDRLFPVPRPRITTSRTIPADAKFFCIGACFARAVERALAAAGRTVLSSQTGLGLPGSVEEQFNRYNVFNLDVGMNEVRWALGVHDAPWDAPLVRMGENHTDLQLHWAFAHPEEKARQYRKMYNDSFKSIVDADVVVLAAAGIRQWFDRQTGIYVNAMPPGSLIKAYPGRFELHEFDVEGCADRLRFAIRTIRDNCPRAPLILVGVAPVWQPMSLTSGDSLIDQLKVKATQRLAVDDVCAEQDGVEYLPAMENALLGDFQFGFLDNSPNHTSPHLAERVVSDLLEDYGADDHGPAILSARSHGEAALMAGDPARALALCEPVATAGAANSDFALLYARALSRSGRTSDAITYLVEAIGQRGASQPERLWLAAVQLLRPDEAELAERLRSVGERIGADLRYLEARLTPRSQQDGTVRKALTDAALAMRERDFERALAALEAAKEWRRDLLPMTRDRYDIMKLQSLAGLKRFRLAVEGTVAALREDDQPSPTLFKQACVTLGKSLVPENLVLIDALERIGVERFSEEQQSEGAVHTGMEKLRSVRKKVTQRAAMRATRESS